MGRRWSKPELGDRDALARLLREHGTARAVAEALEISDRAVRRAMSKHGLMIGPPGRRSAHPNLDSRTFLEENDGRGPDDRAARGFYQKMAAELTADLQTKPGTAGDDRPVRSVSPEMVRHAYRRFRKRRYVRFGRAGLGS